MELHIIVGIFFLLGCLAMAVYRIMEFLKIPNQEYWNKKRYIESNFKIWVTSAYEETSDKYRRQKYIDRIVGYMKYHKLQEKLINIKPDFVDGAIEFPILIKLIDETTYATNPPIIYTRVNLIPQLKPQTKCF